jgi:hypothetical protein
MRTRGWVCVLVLGLAPANGSPTAAQDLARGSAMGPVAIDQATAQNRQAHRRVHRHPRYWTADEPAMNLNRRRMRYLFLLRARLTLNP